MYSILNFHPFGNIKIFTICLAHTGQYLLLTRPMTLDTNRKWVIQDQTKYLITNKEKEMNLRKNPKFLPIDEDDTIAETTMTNSPNWNRFSKDRNGRVL